MGSLECFGMLSLEKQWLWHIQRKICELAKFIL
jgi:hypothetical protein